MGAKSLLAIGLIAVLGCGAEPQASDSQPITAVQPNQPSAQPGVPNPAVNPVAGPNLQQPPVNPVPDPNVQQPPANPVPDPNVQQPPVNPVPDPNVQQPPVNPVPDPNMMPIAGSGPAEDPVMMQPPAMPATGSGEPTIPAVSAQCPTFRSGTISFMGLGGIQIAAGGKPASPTAPMVFYWHGTGSTAGEFALMAGAVNSGVASEGGVLVSFQGTTGGDLLSGTLIFGEGDLNLVDQLVACGVQDHNIDPRRIYATGCSAGGLFSGAMAALRSQYVAAAAPNSGGWVLPVRFANDHTPALMTVHGRAGLDVVVIDFSVSSKTADDGFKGRGGFVINCDHGGGHCGGGPLAGDIWKFFKAHPYGTSPSPWAGGLPAGFNSACKIY